MTDIVALAPVIGEAINVFRPEGRITRTSPASLPRESIDLVHPALPHTGGNVPVKVQIDSKSCQGHGRCYDLAPGLFGADDEGYGTVLGDGTVPPDREQTARLAVLNCPEQAIELVEGW